MMKSRVLTTTVPVLMTLGLGEMAMQNLGERLPLPVLPLRRELGIVSPDPRWQQSQRYGPRLRPHLNTFLEWQYGDIVQMTFIPPEVSPRTVSRFSFRTDSEGFRNTHTRTNIHVAALGDSFTDSMTLPEENIWPTLLEQALGKPVQNYGTAGFGPQQELHVLEDYAIHHHPRVVVVAFFAGNDIFNAEKTDELERSGEAIQRPLPGWKIKKVVARYETFYLFALMSRAASQLWGTGSTSANQGKPSPVSEDLQEISDSGPAFDRGMFSVPIKQRRLRFALMPPYLQTLGFSKEDLENRLGWKVTCATLLKMKSISEGSGARLIVMFIPFKSQVVLPLLRRSFRDDDLRETFRFYFRQRPTMFDLQSMSTNRLAQNELMRHFCEKSNIPLLDLTPTFQEKFESGRNLYFSDDSHWNAEGHALAAVELAQFMRERGLHQ
jgi:lysophospholipase L1-like esterase